MPNQTVKKNLTHFYSLKIYHMKRALKKRYATGLAAIRHQHGYTQAAFAQLLGVTRSTLNMAERGLRSLPAEASFKISDLELERLQKEGAAPPPAPPGTGTS